jgi:hypothetical protein
MAKPVFEAWLPPLRDLEATTVAGATAPPHENSGGTDHTSLTWIGLPGFGFIQDSMEYQRGHIIRTWIFMIVCSQAI